MPIIDNWAEHPYEFPQGRVVDEKGTVHGLAASAVMIPWRNKDHTPSKVRVTDETLKAMQADPVAKGWFGPGQLAIGQEPALKEDRDKIVDQPPPPKPLEKFAPAKTKESSARA